MFDAKLLTGFDNFSVVRRQFKKYSARLHRHALVACRLLRTTHAGRAPLRRGSSA